MSMDKKLDEDYLKTLSVLYVEDDNDTRKQFSEFLTRPIRSLITAVNGLEGLEAFKREAPDIVITDIMMPKMDGLAMANEIKGISPTVPIIVVTAFEETDYLKRAIDIGIDKYVTKPINSDLLFDSLLESARHLRAEEELKLKHQREIQEALSHHNETFAILAGGMAEDYNNLMQTILGYASLAIVHIEPDSKVTDYLEQILKCSDQAHHLGKMLRILGNDYTDNTRCAPLMGCIRNSIQNALAHSTIELRLDYPEDLPNNRFVEEQMQLLFEGLATNALEAMPSGGSLQLSAHLTEVIEHGPVPLTAGKYILVSLTDSGTGIAPEVLQNIFEPYFSTKERSRKRGTGLNLALCRTVIMRHGGLITAESVPGSSATFRVWLPIAG